MTKNTEVQRPSMRYHGGKFRIADWIQSFFPPHDCYVEPFGGAAGVLLQKPRSYAEVYNDLDGDVVSFFRVLRDPEQRERLITACMMTPYSRADFEQSSESTDDPIERARRTAIRAQMGLGSAGATKGATGFRIDTKREYGTAQALWALYPDAIANAGKRLSGVLIENRPAIEVISQHDGPHTLFFCDPPYVHMTRQMQRGKTGYYRHEMEDSDHVELIECLQSLSGMVVLSGYDNPLYSEMLVDWEQHSKHVRISAGRGGSTREDSVWLNSACSRRPRQQRMDFTVDQTGAGST